jgi:hypothetical protein
MDCSDGNGTAMMEKRFDGEGVDAFQGGSRALQASQEDHDGQVSAAEDMHGDYRIIMQQALRSIKSGVGGFVHSDKISWEGLQGLPMIALKGIGRLGLPLSAEQQGDSTPQFAGTTNVCSFFHPRLSSSKVPATTCIIVFPDMHGKFFHLTAAFFRLARCLCAKTKSMSV